MKHLSKILALLLSLCLVLSLGAFASGEPSGDPSAEPSGEPSGDPSAEAGAVKPGTYTDGEYTLEIADDLTFSMEQVGANLEGEEFVLYVSGTVTEDGQFAITGLSDGSVDLIELATEEQIAGNLAIVEEVYAAATASAEPSGEAPAGDITVNDDGTFVLMKTGQNMEGEEFPLKVTGIINDDGSVTLTGIFDGDLDLMELATEDQIAADTASVLEALGR